MGTYVNLELRKGDTTIITNGRSSGRDVHDVLEDQNLGVPDFKYSDLEIDVSSLSAPGVNCAKDEVIYMKVKHNPTGVFATYDNKHNPRNKWEVENELISDIKDQLYQGTWGHLTIEIQEFLDTNFYSDRSYVTVRRATGDGTTVVNVFTSDWYGAEDWLSDLQVGLTALIDSYEYDEYRLHFYWS